MDAVNDVVGFDIPTTPTRENAMDCVRARYSDANRAILAIDLGKCKGVLRVSEPSEPWW
jgi:hypothetical protein